MRFFKIITQSNCWSEPTFLFNNDKQFCDILLLRSSKIYLWWDLKEKRFTLRYSLKFQSSFYPFIFHCICKLSFNCLELNSELNRYFFLFKVLTYSYYFKEKRFRFRYFEYLIDELLTTYIYIIMAKLRP